MANQNSIELNRLTVASSRDGEIHHFSVKASRPIPCAHVNARGILASSSLPKILTSAQVYGENVRSLMSQRNTETLAG